jgi:hypothetical protein
MLAWISKNVKGFWNIFSKNLEQNGEYAESPIGGKAIARGSLMRGRMCTGKN